MPRMGKPVTIGGGGLGIAVASAAIGLMFGLIVALSIAGW